MYFGLFLAYVAGGIVGAREIKGNLSIGDGDAMDDA